LVTGKILGSGPSFSSDVGTPGAAVKIITTDEFRSGLAFGDTSITTAHIRGFIDSQASASFGSKIDVTLGRELSTRPFLGTDVTRILAREVPTRPKVVQPIASDRVVKGKSWLPISALINIKSLSAFIRVATPDTTDITARIKAGFDGELDLPAIMKVIRQGDKNLIAIATPVRSAIKNLPTILVSLRKDTKDLPTIIVPLISDTKDLPALLSPFSIFDLQAILESIPPEDLSADLQPIPPKDLPTDLFAIASVDLTASGGGHFPEDLAASASPVLPFDLAAVIRGGFTDIKDLTASLVQKGALFKLTAFVRILQPAFKDLPAKLIVREPKDLTAFIQGLGELDLSASLITQREKQLRAIILGTSPGNIKNLSAIIRRVDAQIEDLKVSPIKAVVSTHTTTGKLPNLDKVAKPFFQNEFVFGTQSQGFFVLNIEPIFGIFPDLHAEIFAQIFFRDNIGGFIRAAELGIKALPANTIAVTPYININKLVLSLIPLLNLTGDLVQRGGFKGLIGITKPVHKAQTGTADDAGFVRVASSFKFFLGTTKGLFVAPKVEGKIRIETFSNSFPFPDLHAVIIGHNESDLSASIREYPFLPITASIIVTDLDHLKGLSANLIPNRIVDLGASLIQFGAFTPLTASIIIDGVIKDLSATLVSVITPISFDVVSVSTQPFSDLSAIIGFERFVRCAPTSSIKALGAYVRVLITGTPDTIIDLPADITALSLLKDLGADIIGRKRTRIRLLGLEFRSRIRSNTFILGTLTPVIPTIKDLVATLTGLSHEFDLPAELNAITLVPQNPEIDNLETIVNLKTSQIKDVLLSFRSQIGTYVYESLTNSIFPTERNTWTVDLRTLLSSDSFFDLAENNKEIALEEISEFFTLDEAIRNAIVLLTEGIKVNLSALVDVRGAINDLAASIGIRGVDRTSNLGASVTLVVNIPDISASINVGLTSSSFLHLVGIIGVQHTQVVEDISASLEGTVINDLSAEVVAI